MKAAARGASRRNAHVRRIQRNPESLSAAEARRTAVWAQGLADPRPPGRVDGRHLDRVLARVGLFQVDSVNVLVRSHYLPAFSRLGPYSLAVLDAHVYKKRKLFEYWGHEASLIPVGLYPLLRWRMKRMANPKSYGRFAIWAKENPALIKRALREVSKRGPIAASDLSDPGGRRGPWWGWPEGKAALEWLFYTGRVTTWGRRNFERLYDLTERVIPAEVLTLPAPADREAQLRLAVSAAKSLGVATASEMADYWRLPKREAHSLAEEATAAGELLEVSVEAWKKPAYMHPATKVPEKVSAAALLSPFDSLVWERARTERLFGMRYRIEIYTPAPKRVFGYYVMPFLLDDNLVARVDLKADRSGSVLMVKGVFAEPGRDPEAISGPLSKSIAATAEWLGLGGVEVARNGDLSSRVRRHFS